MVAHTCNLKTWEIEARRGGVQDEKKERTGVRALTAQALEPDFRSLGPTQKKLGWTTPALLGDRSRTAGACWLPA